MPATPPPGSRRGWRNGPFSGSRAIATRPRRRPGRMRKTAFVYDASADALSLPAGSAARPTPPPTATATDTTRPSRGIAGSAPCWPPARATPRPSAPSPATSGRTPASGPTPTASHRWGKAIYKRRKETVERSFADAKQLFGHRYARFRGLPRVSWQCLLAAAAQNMKKIALVIAPESGPPARLRARTLLIPIHPQRKTKPAEKSTGFVIGLRGPAAQGRPPFSYRRPSASSKVLRMPPASCQSADSRAAGGVAVEDPPRRRNEVIENRFGGRAEAVTDSDAHLGSEIGEAGDELVESHRRPRPRAPAGSEP